MKILFSGYHNPNFITITEYIEEAIKNIGHELVAFDDRQHIIPGRIRQRIKFANSYDLQHINKKFVSLSVLTKPDIAIVTGGHRIQPKSIKELKDNGLKTVLWTIDAPVNFKPIIEVASCYDHIFCGGTEAQVIFNRNKILNTNWLPFACASKFHRPLTLTPEEKKKYAKDIVFVGSFYPNRWDILKELNDFEIGIWGPNWNKVKLKSLGRISINNIQLKHTDWLKIYAAAKIIIVIHFQDGKTPCHQASPKVYEALACKRFVLVDRQKDVFSLFNDKEHLVSFENTRDLIEKITYYLKNKKEREKIASEGYKEVLKKHTYVHRIKNLLSVIKN